MNHSISRTLLLSVLGTVSLCIAAQPAQCQSPDWKTTSTVELPSPEVRHVIMGSAGTKAVPALLYVDGNGLNEVRGDGAGKLIGQPFLIEAGVVDAAPGNYVSGGLHGLVVLFADSRGVGLYLQDQFDDKTLSAAKPIATIGLKLDQTCRLFSGDFNGDSLDDFGVFCQSAPGFIWIAVNDAGGDFVVTAHQLSGVGPVSSVFAQDVNQDGKSDLIVSTQGQRFDEGTTTAILLNSPNGFVAGSTSPFQTNRVFYVGNISGDGTMALVSYDRETGTAFALGVDSSHHQSSLPAVDAGCTVTAASLGSLINQYRGVLANDLVLAENCGGTARLVTKSNPFSSVMALSVMKSLTHAAGLVTLSVSVRGVNNSVAPTGSVRVMVDGTSVGTVSLGQGDGAIDVTLGGGKHTVTAIYGGDSTFSRAAGVLVVHNQARLITNEQRSRYPRPAILTPLDYKRGSGNARFIRAQAPAQISNINTGGLTILNPSVQNCPSCFAPGAPSYVPGTTLTRGSGYVIGDVSITGAYVYNDCQQQIPQVNCPIQPDPYVNEVDVLIDGIAVGTATVPYDDSTYAQCGDPSGFTESCQSGSLWSYFPIPNTIPPGQHTIQFNIVGGSGVQNGPYGGVTVSYIGASETFTFTLVGQIGSTTTLTSSPNPSNYGQNVTLTATVTNGATGTVQFYDGGTLIGSSTVTGNTASFGTAAFSVGSHTLTAVYGGDSTYLSSTSNTVIQGVNKITVGGANYLLTSAPNPSVYAQTVSFTATFVGLTPAPTGTVQFYDGGTLIGSSALSGGVATLSTSSLAVGNHPVIGVYSGDAIYNGASSNTDNQIVNPASVTVTVSGVPNPSGYTQNVIITVQLTPPSGGVVPTGSVTITDGSTTLGVVNLNGSGAGTLNIATLSVGDHAIVGAYNGDANYH